jgi:hypothetical protein
MRQFAVKPAAPPACGDKSLAKADPMLPVARAFERGYFSEERILGFTTRTWLLKMSRPVQEFDLRLRSLVFNTEV